jgi:regulator of protease activity HflC (stomatin/prohibitin superfamily)
MFDKLFEFILTFGRMFRPWWIVYENQGATVLRFGAYHRTIMSDDGVFGRGFHWIWPFSIEKVYYETILTRVQELQSQALMTKDGKPIIAGVVITYSVKDIKKALWAVHDVFTAITDACLATLAEAVITTDLVNIGTPKFSEDLTKACRSMGFRYGIEIEKVRLHELAPSRTIRLIGTGDRANT